MSAISEYANANGMEIVRTYTDSGKSGLNLKGRCALQSLLRDVDGSNPEFQAILVYDVSRWGRFPDPDESAAYVHACKSKGIPVIYCAEPFQNDGSLPSTILIGLKRSMAAEYSRELSDKVFKGACTIVRHGYRQGGAAGFGLRRQLTDESNNPKQILVRGQKKSLQTDRIVLVPGPPDEVATVLRIYRLFVEDSLPERVIAARLNRDSIRNGIGTEWTRATVHQVLTNEKYIGNNVYNRTSFKLKQRFTHNPPEQWIRKRNAFEAIVPEDLFYRAQSVIAARARRLTDEEMLDALRDVLRKHGAITKLLIDEEESTPSSSSYRTRFGTLIHAYAMIGYAAKHDYQYLMINNFLNLRRRQLLSQIARDIERHGGRTQTCPDSLLLKVNNELRVSVVLARCKRMPSYTRRWRVKLDSRFQPELTVVVRMDDDNLHPRDYFVIPSIDMQHISKPLKEDNGFTLDAYRTRSLEQLFTLTSRISLMEAACPLKTEP